MQVRTLDQFNEVLNIQEAAELCGVSHVTFSGWLHSGQTPMGDLVEGVHYFRVGRIYKFIKHQLALLFKMIDPEARG